MNFEEENTRNQASEDAVRLSSTSFLLYLNCIFEVTCSAPNSLTTTTILLKIRHGPPTKDVICGLRLVNYVWPKW
jgi:hypothetical protein